MANPVRIKTASGWADVSGVAGPSGGVLVFEQDNDPGAVPIGSIWIETDVTLAVDELVPDATGQDGKWLQAAGGAAVWTAVPGLLTTADTAWRFVGTASQPAFENGYSSWDGAPGVARAPRFRKLASGLVLLNGILKCPNPATTGLIAFTLPVGYRPATATADQTYWVNGQQFPMLCSVSSAGSVALGNGPTALPASGWVYIDTVRFLAEQ